MEKNFDKKSELFMDKENYLDVNPFKLSKKQLQEDAEAISMFISFASGFVQYEND